MMLAPLTTLLFTTFFVLWLSDFFFTKKCVKTLGPQVEANPIIKTLIKARGKFIYATKSIELITYTLVYTYIQRINEVFAYKLLIIAVFGYGVIVSSGLKIYVRTHESATPVVILFLTIILLALLYAYMAFTEQNNRIMLLDSLKECYTEGGP